MFNVTIQALSVEEMREKISALARAWGALPIEKVESETPHHKEKAPKIRKAKGLESTTGAPQIVPVLAETPKQEELFPSSNNTTPSIAENHHPVASAATIEPTWIDDKTAKTVATQDEAYAALKMLNETKGLTAARNVLAIFGCARPAELSADKYSEVIAACSKAL